jgi:GDP-L-fucose synthase
VYGPHDNFSVDDGHVIPGLIRKCVEAKRNKTDFVVWGSGSPVRQFIHSRDLARLILWALDSYDSVEPIIMSVDEAEEISIRDLALMIAEILSFEGNIVFDETKADGQYKKTASNAKLRRYLPYYQFTPIRQGLSETCAWFEANYDTARK